MSGVVAPGISNLIIKGPQRADAAYSVVTATGLMETVPIIVGGGSRAHLSPIIPWQLVVTHMSFNTLPRKSDQTIQIFEV